MSNEAIAQAQLDAYNSQDLEKHISYFSDDMTIANLREAPNLSGLSAYKERMGGVFKEFPQNKVELLGRTIIGNKVLDHEKVMRSPEAVPFEVIAVYTFDNGKIANVDFIK